MKIQETRLTFVATEQSYLADWKYHLFVVSFVL